MTLKSIRSSALSSYNDCPRRSAANLFGDDIAEAGYYLVKPRQNIGAAIGSGVHAAFQYSLQTKIDSNQSEQGFDDAAEDIAISTLHHDIDGGVHYDGKAASNINQAEKQVIRSTKIVRQRITPSIEPVGVEVAFSAIYKGYEITGHTDVQEIDGMGDLKTGKFQRQNMPQYGAYIMLGLTDGFDVSKFKEYYVPTVPLDKPAPPPSIINIDVDLAKEMSTDRLDYIISDHEGFLRDGNPSSFRANPESILCHPKFCSAYGTKFCREHKDAK